MMRCYLVRHGKDDETVRGGWSNFGLTQFGIDQVHTLGKEVVARNIDLSCIYSSDLPRAKETAEILAGYLHLPVVLLPEFREANNGNLAGMKNDLANEKYPGIYWSTLDYEECYPNGESPEMFYHRVKTAWLEWKCDFRKNSFKDVMLVTHGGVIEAILCIENDLEFSNKTKHFSTPNAKLIPVELNCKEDPIT